MKKIIAILLSTIILGIFSCKKENKTPETIVEVTVTDYLTGKVASGVTVNLYTKTQIDVGNDTASYIAVTGQDGKVKISVAYRAKYFVVAETVDAKGYEHKNYIFGWLPIGIFRTQEEVDSSPPKGQGFESNQIGRPKIQDTNGDGVIDTNDFCDMPSINLTEKANNLYSATIY
ncbi:hypothetical protein SAMN05216464_10976 [Mucilaginibacter pineti]|uniref:EF-hand domain-containing protein n=1 Tax=Mucilaginibacter pineti TaxID=1391627 RepID=A0A1G7FIQ5_9SPHI|nr:hypothetical protein [Mucilaginibacter pineti]SDE75727.1 hypothetical protein SAMN05216464_10976 [Mucilaginibacter pineti]